MKKSIMATLRELIRLYKELIQRKQMELMVIQLCQKAGLSQDDTDIICSVIEGESGFNPEAINVNPNGTTDFGICQFNDYWYWKKQAIIHPSVALKNPKRAVEIMISQYKKGRITDWCVFSSGVYLRYYYKRKKGKVGFNLEEYSKEAKGHIKSSLTPKNGALCRLET